MARYRNSLIGLAAGDAWGYQVEFTPHRMMPALPVPAPDGVWIVSDDTQMTLALHAALSSAPLANIPAVTAAITHHFVAWSESPDNNRAPGRTCMASLAQLSAGAAWYQPDGALTSAGCGAVMRLVPAAFSPDRVWRGLSVLQAVITHNHPRAAVPALLLAGCIRRAQPGGRFIDAALAEADAIRAGTSCALDDPFLADVLSPITSDVHSYLVAGLNDGTQGALLAARDAALDIAVFGRHTDLCAGVGQGWESASAVAVAMLAADAALVDPDAEPGFYGRDTLSWAASTNGDSDSIAAIAGALAGAASTDPDFWSTQQVRPLFEPGYAAMIAAATPAMQPA